MEIINPRPKVKLLPLPLLTDDILLEILSRSPVKSLLRLRCVSKSWHALISTAAATNLLPSAMAGLFLYDRMSREIHFSSLRSRTYIDTNPLDTALTSLIIPSSSSSPPPPRYLRLLDCCNGLLLLHQYLDHHYVYNPATRKCAQIPDPPSVYLKIALAFDPHRSHHYNIISIPQYRYYVSKVADMYNAVVWDCEEAEVFSSETNQWVDVQGFRRIGIDEGIRFPSSSSVFLNGTLYVMGFYGETFAIDIEGRVCRKIEQHPESLITKRHCLGGPGGLLHHAAVVDGEMFVWALENARGDGYVLKQRIRVRDVVDKLPGGEALPDSVDLLAFHPDLDVIFLRLESRIISYHLISTEVEEICDHDADPRFNPLCFAYSPCYSTDLVPSEENLG